MAQPQPGELNRLLSGARIARLADPLLAIGPTALPGSGRQTKIAGDLAPVAEVLVERLVDQRCRKYRAKTFEPTQVLCALRHLGSRRGWLLPRRGLRQRLQLLAEPH